MLKSEFIDERKRSFLVTETEFLSQQRGSGEKRFLRNPSVADTNVSSLKIENV